MENADNPSGRGSCGGGRGRGRGLKGRGGGRGGRGGRGRGNKDKAFAGVDVQGQIGGGGRGKGEGGGRGIADRDRRKGRGVNGKISDGKGSKKGKANEVDAAIEAEKPKDKPNDKPSGSKTKKKKKKKDVINYKTGEWKGDDKLFLSKSAELTDKDWSVIFPLDVVNLVLYTDDEESEYVFKDVCNRAIRDKGKLGVGVRSPPPQSPPPASASGLDLYVADEDADFALAMKLQMEEEALEASNLAAEAASAALVTQLQEAEAAAKAAAEAEAEAAKGVTHSALGVMLIGDNESELGGEGEPLNTNEDTADDSSDELPAPPKSPSSPKRKKVKKKKKTKEEQEAELKLQTYDPAFKASPKTDAEDYYKVSFSTVEVKEYKRDIAFWSVPGVGSWPLGLSTSEVVGDYWGDVDTFEYRKGIDLEERKKHLTEEERKCFTGETRQFDFSGTKRNPIFRRSQEKERKHLLCMAIDPEHEDFQQHKQRKRGLSDADFQQMADGSLDIMQDLLKEVESLGREFDAVRDERDRVGCSCTKLKTKGMREPRLKEELRKRGLPDTGPKDECSARLREHLATECVCTVDCPCAKEGIMCHFDICGCFKMPDGKKNKNGECGSAQGVYKFDQKRINKNRNTWIEGGRDFADSVAICRRTTPKMRKEE